MTKKIRKFIYLMTTIYYHLAYNQIKIDRIKQHIIT